MRNTPNRSIKRRRKGLSHRSRTANRRARAGSGVKAYIGGVGDELPEEDLLVGVKGVDDEGEQLVDLRLEGERLRLRGHGEALPER